MRVFVLLCFFICILLGGTWFDMLQKARENRLKEQNQTKSIETKKLKVDKNVTKVDTTTKKDIINSSILVKDFSKKNGKNIDLENNKSKNLKVKSVTKTENVQNIYAQQLEQKHKFAIEKQKLNQEQELKKIEKNIEELKLKQDVELKKRQMDIKLKETQLQKELEKNKLENEKILKQQELKVESIKLSNQEKENKIKIIQELELKKLENKKNIFELKSKYGMYKLVAIFVIVLFILIILFRYFLKKRKLTYEMENEKEKMHREKDIELYKLENERLDKFIDMLNSKDISKESQEKLIDVITKESNKDKTIDVEVKKKGLFYKK
jgi:uncharacterized membrane protein